MVVWKVIRWNNLIIVMVASSSNNLLKGDACWMDIELGLKIQKEITLEMS